MTSRHVDNKLGESSLLVFLWIIKVDLQDEINQFERPASDMT